MASQLAAAAGVGDSDSNAESSTTASSSGEGAVGASWASWASKTRKMVMEKVAYDAVPQAEPGSQEADVERAENPLSNLGTWAKALGTKVSKEATKVGEKAKSLDLSEQTKGLQHQVSKGFKNVSEGASSAGAAFSETGKAAQQRAKELGSKSKEQLDKAKAASAETAKMAKDKATSAAAGAKGALSQAGQSLSGLTALTMSPSKLAQFAGVFLLGMFLISTSFSFLPVFIIAPQKFALLFAFGSMTMLGSLTILKGPQAFFTAIIQRPQLPFTVAYAIGLVGTLVSTILLKSFVLTAIFGVLQALALLYFMASFVPGGQRILNFCGKCCSKSARAVGGRLMR